MNVFRVSAVRAKNGAWYGPLLWVLALWTLTHCSEKSADPGTAQKTSPATKKPGTPAKTPGAGAAAMLPPGNGPVATVNGTEIPRERFNRQFLQTIERYKHSRQVVRPALRERLKDNIVRRLIEAELIRQQAQKLKIEVPEAEKTERWKKQKERYGTEVAFKTFLEKAGTTEEDVKQTFLNNLLRERVFEQVSAELEVPPSEIKDFYEKYKKRYTESERVRASHILLKVPSNASKADKKAKKSLAKKLLRKAKKKKADFAALAKEHSDDSTKTKGGDLGYFGKGRMVKPFEEAAWKLKVGRISGIVESKFGFHIIKKTDHKKERTRPLSEVHEQIERSLLARRKNSAKRESLKKWREAAKIEIFVKGDKKIIAEGQKRRRPTPPGTPPGLKRGTPSSAPSSAPAK